MTAGRDMERLISDWLVEESPRRAPDRILGNAGDVIDRTTQRRPGVAWRLGPLFGNRLSIAAIAIVVVATSVLVIGRLPSIGPPRPSPTINPTPAGSVEPTIELPAARAVAPTAVIDLAGKVHDAIPLTTDGTDVWVGIDRGVIEIDGATNATRQIDVPHMGTGNGGIAITPEGLWIEDYVGNRIELVDLATGAVDRTLTINSPLVIVFVDDQLWISSNSMTGAYLVDRETAEIGPPIGASKFFAVGLDDIWAGEWDAVEGDHLQADLITRLDTETGAATGTVAVPAGTGCAVGGSFPDNIWSSCPADFGTCPANRIAVRIDPNTNDVVTTAKICGGPVAVIDGTPWFLAGRKVGSQNANSLVSVDPATGQLLAQLDLGTIDPDGFVLTDTALWASDEQGDRIVRYDLTALRS